MHLQLQNVEVIISFLLFFVVVVVVVEVLAPINSTITSQEPNLRIRFVTLSLEKTKLAISFLDTLLTTLHLRKAISALHSTLLTTLRSNIVLLSNEKVHYISSVIVKLKHINTFTQNVRTRASQAAESSRFSEGEVTCNLIEKVKKQVNTKQA